MRGTGQDTARWAGGQRVEPPGTHELGARDAEQVRGRSPALQGARGWREELFLSLKIWKACSIIHTGRERSTVLPFQPDTAKEQSSPGKMYLSLD